MDYTRETLLPKLGELQWTSDGDGGIAARIPKEEWEKLGPGPGPFNQALADNKMLPSVLTMRPFGLHRDGGPADYEMVLQYNKEALAKMQEDGKRFWSEESLTAQPSDQPAFGARYKIMRAAAAMGQRTV